MYFTFASPSADDFFINGHAVQGVKMRECQKFHNGIYLAQGFPFHTSPPPLLYVVCIFFLAHFPPWRRQQEKPIIANELECGSAKMSTSDKAATKANFRGQPSMGVACKGERVKGGLGRGEVRRCSQSATAATNST